MSVTGEYSRLLGNLLEYLEASEAPAAAALHRQFERCRLEHFDNVSEAAMRARSACEAAADAPLDAEAERYDAHREHLVAVCHAILGR